MANTGTTTVLNLDTVTSVTGGTSTGQANHAVMGGWAQHIVYAPGGGIFVAYVSDGQANPTGSDVRGYWRLKRCPENKNPTVAGNWTLVYDSATDDTYCHHLAMDADENGNVYVICIYPNPRAGAAENTTYFYKFPIGNYANPTYVSRAYGTSKMSAIYDPYRKKLYEMLVFNAPSGGSHLITYNLDGTVAATSGDYFNIGSQEQNVVEYCCAGIGPNGLLIYSWATQDNTLGPTSAGHSYYNTGAMTSTDGGKTWFDMKGAQIGFPIVGDEAKVNVCNTTDTTEFNPYTSNAYPPDGNWNIPVSAVYNNGFIIFSYAGSQPTKHSSIVKYNLSTHTFVHRYRAPIFGNWSSSPGLAQDDTYTGRLFYSGPDDAATSPLYTYYSDDSGATWSLYSTSGFTLAANNYGYCGVARVTAPDVFGTNTGYLMGVFSDANGAGPTTATLRVWLVTVDAAALPPPAPTLPSNTSLPTITVGVHSPPWQGDTLTAGPGVWSGTTPISYAYAWNRDGVASGATGQTLALGAADVGHAMTVTVTATNTAGSVPATSGPTNRVVAAGTAPANAGGAALPAISGTATQDQTLTASNGTWTGTTPIIYTYAWKRDGVAIGGATAQTYVLVVGDVDAMIAVTVTATNSIGSAVATSPGVGPVIATPPPATPPANAGGTALPSISGTTQVGEVLTASPGTWTGTTPITYVYSWSNGQTGQTCTLQVTDVGARISVQVTATNSVGHTSATSADVGPVTSVPLPPPLTFPITEVLDQFSTTANPLPAPWTATAFCPAGMQSNGTVAFSAGVDGTIAGSLWTGAAFNTPPIEVYVDIPQVPAVASHNVYLHWANEGAGAGENTFYGYRVGFNNTQGVGEAGGHVIIHRFAAGGVTTLLNQTNLGLFVSGNSVGMTIDDSGLITAYRKQGGTWTVLTSYQDMSPLWLVAPAIPLQYIGIGTADASAQFANFGGGSIAFPTTPCLDTFNSVANPLGGAWTNGIGTYQGFQTNGTVAVPLTATAGALWTGMAWPTPPIEVYADIVQVPANTANNVSLYWSNGNLSGADYYGYRIGYSNVAGGTVDVHRVAAGVTGVSALLGTAVTGVGTLQAGDSIGMQINETGAITVYRARSSVWAPVATFSDPTPLWTLSPTNPLRYIGIGTTDTAARFDNFGGGGLTPVVPPSIISVPALVTT